MVFHLDSVMETKEKSAVVDVPQKKEKPAPPKTQLGKDLVEAFEDIIHGRIRRVR